MLTKLSSICVLEYLGFEKRLYIVSQVPEFRKVEKSLPLNLDTLCISSSGIRLNESDYRLSPCTQELRKILEKPPYNITSFGSLSSYDRDKLHGAFKKVIHQLIGDRPMICTRKLELCDLSHWESRERRDLKIYQLPKDLKLRAEMLETSGISLSYADLDLVSNILGSKPLKELSIRLDNYQIIQHPIVRNSQKLVLWSGRADFDRQRIPHKNIYLKDNNQFLAYSDEWIRNQNEIGMEFSGDVGYRYPDTWKMVSEESIKRIMYLKKCQSGGRSVKADERFPNTVYSIAVPRTDHPNTEIQISLLKNESNAFPLQMHLKTQTPAIPKRSVDLGKYSCLGSLVLFFGFLLIIFLCFSVFSLLWK